MPGYARRHHRGDYDDGASDISSTSGFGSAYGYRSGSRKFFELFDLKIGFLENIISKIRLKLADAVNTSKKLSGFI